MRRLSLPCSPDWAVPNRKKDFSLEGRCEGEYEGGGEAMMVRDEDAELEDEDEYSVDVCIEEERRGPSGENEGEGGTVGWREK